MHLVSYLSFDKQCRAAFEFYQKVLGGEMYAMTFGEMPPGEYEAPPESRDLIMHACLNIGDQMLMGADCPPTHPYEGVKGCSVSIMVDTADEAQRVFDALAEGGNVLMPLQETFWAIRFGMLTDRFGVPWMVNCGKPN
ncbi:MAG: VOC family protein [Planctomycetaceae bacterium]